MRLKTSKLKITEKKEIFKLLFLFQTLIIVATVVFLACFKLDFIASQYTFISENYIFITLSILSGIIGLGSIYLFNEIVKLIEHEKEYELKKIEFLQMEESNDLLRSQKHDFSNNLQVVWGMLSIGKTQKAKEYIEKYTNMLKIDEEELEEIKYIDNTYLYTLFLNKSYKCKEKGIEISYDIEKNIRIEKFNPVDIVRILGNLIDNAIYAVKNIAEEHREIFVEIYCNGNEYIFSVSNKGPQIPINIRERIFEKDFTTKGKNGSGLGLYNVKQLVDKYSGKVWLETDEYIGTKFTVSFPK